MLVYMMIGFVLYKNKILDKNGTKSLSNLLVYIVLPCVVLHSFMMPYSKQGVALLLESSIGTVVSMAISFVVCSLIFRNDTLTKVGTTFSNVGFIGIPLITAAFGQNEVIRVIPLQMLTVAVQYSYAAISFEKNGKEKAIKDLIKNPLIIAVFIGLIMYLANIGDKLPSVINNTINGIFNSQTPLAMIVTGTYLAQIDFKKLKLKKDLAASFVRLVLIPLLLLISMKFLPMSETTKAIILIASSCSIGSNIAVYAEKFDGDYKYACEVVAFSTLLSIITLPIIMTLL